MITNRIASQSHIVTSLRFSGRPKSENPLFNLSDSEKEVMDQIAEGKTNGEIARDLLKSERTIENHAHRAYKKILDESDTKRELRGTEARHQAAVKYIKKAREL